jgi:hypothetical protein
MLWLIPNEAGGGFVGKYLVALLLAASLTAPASAQDLLGARTFVAQLYMKKTNDPHFHFASPRVLTPDLYQLTESGGAQALGYDPLCLCKDNDGLSAQILSVTGTAKQVLALVLLRFDADRPPPPQRVTLVLTHSLAGWKIADIQTVRVPSLRAWLARRGRTRG